MLEDCTEEERAEELKEARMEERMSNCSVEGALLGQVTTFSLDGSRLESGSRFSLDGCRQGLMSSCSGEFELLAKQSSCSRDL